MTRFAIVHFQPVELYPPVMNFLNYLSEKKSEETEVRVFTMRTGISNDLNYHSSGIKIFRRGNSKKRALFFRYCNYIGFYISAIADLIFWKPDVILYYETLSALPPFFYKKFINKNCRLLIHYHEYTSAQEYKNGMMLSRWLHDLEKKIYSVSDWISQTNSDRMRFFLEENKNVPVGSIHIMPNYPPISWRSDNNNNLISLPVKFVYVGALSLDTMYTEEFAKWIIEHKEQMTWDIYSTNITDEALAYLSSLKTDRIKFHGGVNYFSLPDALKQYNIGVILYKGHIPNYVYNAPNKLFEYWACGLDVWFPQKMNSSLLFTTTNCFPKIIAVNFDNLEQLNVEDAASHSGLNYEPSPYYCEQIFDTLFEQGIKNNDKQFL
jgi:hypothetical protein